MFWGLGCGHEIMIGSHPDSQQPGRQASSQAEACPSWRGPTAKGLMLQRVQQCMQVSSLITVGAHGGACKGCARAAAAATHGLSCRGAQQEKQRSQAGTWRVRGDEQAAPWPHLHLHHMA